MLQVFFSVLTRKQEVVRYLSFNLDSLKAGHLSDDFLVLIDLVQKKHIDFLSCTSLILIDLHDLFNYLNECSFILD